MGTLFAEIGPQKLVPRKRSKPFIVICFEPFWSSTKAPTLCTPKNGPPQVDAKERPRRSHKTFIFKWFFVHFVLRTPLGDRPRHALHFQNMQFRIGFIDVFDALIESNLDHRTVTPKSKNERHAAWERSGAKRNERNAAWERFSYF